MKLSKKTRRLMTASVGASALMACATAVAQEPALPPSIQLDPSLPRTPSVSPDPSLQQMAPQGTRLVPNGVELPAKVPQCTTSPMAASSKLTTSALNSIFKDADTNKDGSLSPTEFQSAYQKIIEATASKTKPPMVLPPTTPAATLPNRRPIQPPAFACPGCGMG